MTNGPGYGELPPGFGGYGQYGGYGPYGGYPPYGKPPAPKPGIVPLRPLSMGEILDGAFTSIRWNPKTILGSSAIVAVASNLLSTILALILVRDVFTNVHAITNVPAIASANGVAPTGSQVASFAVALFAVLGAVIVISLAARTILTGILTIAIGQAVLGVKETLGGGLKRALTGFWRLLGTGLLIFAIFAGTIVVLFLIVLVLAVAHLAVVAVIVGVVGGIAAGVFLIIAAVRWSLAVPVTMLERAGPARSLRRSWRLVKGSSWRVFGITLLTYLIVIIAEEAINVPFTLAAGGSNTFTNLSQHGTTAPQSVLALVITGIGAIIGQAVTGPLNAGVSTLLYGDLRMRREGLDIALQAAAAAPAGQPAAPGAVADIWLLGTDPVPPRYPGPGYPGYPPPGGQYPGPQYPGSHNPGPPYPGPQNPGPRYPGPQ